MQSSDLVLYDRRGPVVTLTVNRPDALNALNAAVSATLAEAVERASADHQVRVLVLTGAGTRAFVAGADVTELVEMSPVEAEARALQAKALHDRFRRCRKPVIAAINGYCLGGGFELALACDVRIASRNAQFGLPEIKLGVLPGGGGVSRLIRLVGSATTRALCMLGETIDAERALALGIVHKLYAVDELMKEAASLADNLAAKSQVALAQIKELAETVADMDLDTAQLAEAKAFALCFTAPDQRALMRAFIDKSTARK